MYKRQGQYRSVVYPPKTRQRLLHRRSLSLIHICIIFVTHDVDEALLIGHELVLLKAGQAPIKRQIAADYPMDLASTELVARKADILRILR